MHNALLNWIFAPGFFQSVQVRNALLLGGMVAAVCGVLGVFIVIRGQAFVGHAVADFGGAGAALAFLLGMNTLWGFLFFGLLSAAGVELLGKRAKERDIATGVVLSLALGLEALFLFLDTRYTGSAGAPMLILFGSVFTVRFSTVAIVAAMTCVALVILGVVYRPLLLCSLDPELAGVSTCKYAGSRELKEPDVVCVSKSEVNRRFVKELSALMDEFFNRRIDGDYPIMMLDGITVEKMTVIAAMGIGRDKCKRMLGLLAPIRILHISLCLLLHFAPTLPVFSILSFRCCVVD